MRLAYIAQGKLTLLAPDQPARRIESQFAKEAIGRLARSAQRKQWKNSGGSGMWQGANLWGVKDDFDARAVSINFADVSPGAHGGEILYCLQSDKVCGLFSYTLSEDRELRLFHKNDFHLGDISHHPAQPAVLGALHNDDGTCHLILFPSDSPHYRQLTDGDSRDEAPHWCRHDASKLVYQASGVARNSQGYCVGYGPSALMRLDTVTGELVMLAEDAKRDLLQPRTNAQGDLFFIRRPYQARPWEHNQLWRTLSDFLLFPFRLLRAVFHYLNVFSMIYARKPLKTTGGPDLPEQDMSRALLRGRVLDVQKALGRYQQAEGTPALVPKSWELVHQGLDGRETVLAQGVSAFDVGRDGDVVYTNGTGIFRLGEDGKAERIGRDWLVERVVAL